MKKIVLVLSLLLIISGVTQAQVQARIGTVEDAVPGTEIKIPIYLSGFSTTSTVQLSAVDFRFFCDTSIAKYNRIEINNSFTNQADWISNGVNGSVRANWLEPNFGAITFPDNSAIIEFVMDYRGGNTNLIFDLCVLADQNLNAIENIELIEGSITQAAGSGATLWNGTGSWATNANWSNGAPGDSTVAKIVSGQVEIDNSAVCKTLTVETGTTLIIKPGGSLTVNDTLINNGSIVAEANATLYGSLIIGEHIQQTGSTTIQRSFEAGQAYGIGSVVANGPATSYTAGGTLQSFAENQNLFAGFSGSNLADGTGYLFASSGNNVLDIDGQPIVSMPSKTLAYTAGSSAAVSGWNFLANPFTSAYSLVDGLTVTNADKALYAWYNGRYHVWNGTTGSLTNGVIPYGCAFFVKANNANGEVTMKNEGKQHSFSAFTGGVTSTATILPITVSDFDGTGKTDLAIIQLDGNATFGFDGQYDAWKLPNSTSMPELYLMGDNGIKLAIAAVPFAPAVMKMGFRSPASGAYTITADAFAFNPGSPVSLYDKVLEATKDLRIENHSFQSDAGTFDDRFELILSGVGIEEPNRTTEQFLVFSANRQIRVKAVGSSIQPVTIQVSDIRGRILTTNDWVSSPGSEFNLVSKQGIRIVTVRSIDSVEVFKVIVL